MYKPNFRITNNLVTYISSIEAAKALIDHAPLVPAWEAKFRNEALQRTVHFGTKIEGNDLTEEQAKRLVQVQIDANGQESQASPAELARQAGIIARERDVQEVINYRQAMAWIDQLETVKTQDTPALSKVFAPETLKTLHALTMKGLLEPEQIGEYRQKQVIVRGAQDGGVVFRPPVSMEVPFLVEEFFSWLTSEGAQAIHSIFRAAITHYHLVYIHPFIEGNGRSARAMASLVLYQSGYDFKKFFSLEQYFDSDVEKYYQALLSVQQSEGADLTFWLEYFCYGVAVEIDKIKSQVMKLSKDLKLQRELGAQVALSERQILLLEALQNQGELTSELAQQLLPNVSTDTILRDLKDLIQKGVVKKFGVTKGVRYVLTD
jgi:Fic family protein